MSALLHRQKTQTQREREKFSESWISSRDQRVSRARVFPSLVWLSWKSLTVEQRNGMHYTRRIFARGVVDLTDCTRVFKSLKILRTEIVNYEASHFLKRLSYRQSQVCFLGKNALNIVTRELK